MLSAEYASTIAHENVLICSMLLMNRGSIPKISVANTYQNFTELETSVRREVGDTAIQIGKHRITIFEADKSD